MKVVLAVEQLPQNQTLLDEDWYTIPINALRNIALHNAPTEARAYVLCLKNTAAARKQRYHIQQVVMLLDGDFVPGPPTLHAHLRHTVLPALRGEMTQHGLMLVVPALDCQVPWEQGPDGLPVFPVSQHDAVMRRMFMHANATEEATGKAAVAEALETGHVAIFQIDYHSNTNYKRWLTANEPYNVKGREGVRPFLNNSQSSMVYTTQLLCTVNK